MFQCPPLSELQRVVATPSSPVGQRMRAAYFLRQTYDAAVRDDDVATAEAALATLAAGLRDRAHGSLMRHEFAYVMGQTRDERCCAALEETLEDGSDCAVTRHECAEALGAVGAERSVAALRRARDACPDREAVEIRQTCDVALDYLAWRRNGGDERERPAACACMLSPYSSVDPAPPIENDEAASTEALGGELRDADRPLFERYRAMFSLRNRGGDDAARELGRALVNDESSALLRHEVAYVLGQMRRPVSVEPLTASLRRTGEHRMVRHEAAEALGAIDDPDAWDECERILREFSRDDDVVVRESCLVALDAADYWGHGTIHPDDEGEGDVVVGKGVDSTTDLTFGQRKAVTNGKRCELGKNVTLNHFNVKV